MTDPTTPPVDRKKRIAAIAAVTATLLAAPAEGLRQKAYYDPPGILTVCYGHTGKDVDRSKTYSVAECSALLASDMQSAVRIVDGCQPGLPDSVLIAFSDAVFNMGPTIACDPDKSTAARLLRAKDFVAACQQLPRWNKARVAGVLVSLPGLTKRRQAALDYCLAGLKGST